MATAYIPGAGRRAGALSRSRLKPAPSSRPKRARRAAALPRIADLLVAGSVSPRLAVADKRQALAAIAEIAARRLKIRPQPILDALLAREALGSTGIGHGVAAPHVRLEGLDRIVGVFARLAAPVDFEAVDEQPVDLVFALFAPKGAEADHLRALARIARVLRDAQLRAALRRASGAEEIRLLLAD